MDGATRQVGQTSSAEAARWKRVAELVNGRMVETGLSQADLVRESQVSPTTVRALMTGTRFGYRPATLRAISRALRWSPLAIEEYAATGKTPIEWVDRDVMVRSLDDMIRQTAPPNPLPRDYSLESTLRRIEDKLDRLLAIADIDHKSDER